MIEKIINDWWELILLSPPLLGFSLILRQNWLEKRKKARKTTTQKYREGLIKK